ncbi:hypothetical protein BJX70DRAFT_398126 [Aspergillus crustosus]
MGMPINTAPQANIAQLLNAPSDVPFFNRAVPLALYIENWAIDGCPRKLLPPGTLSLGELCNIVPVCNPHALNVATLGFCRGGSGLEISWQTQLWEYSHTTPNGAPLYPHLILLSLQSCRGEEQSLTLGELTSMVTAMRNRARQRAGFDEDLVLTADREDFSWVDLYEREVDPAQLEFKHEKRFPVCDMTCFLPSSFTFTPAV